MKSIRKLMAVGTGVGALCAVTAFALAPVTVLAEGSHRFEVWQRSAPSATSATTTVAAPSPACAAAIQKIKTAVADDRAEDTLERKNAALAGADPAADVKEDADERATMKALRADAHAACAGQTVTKAAAPAPTAACLAAKQAAKDAWARKDKAALESLWASVKAACSYPTSGRFAFHHEK